eukprot:Em0003g1199a
MGAMWVVVAAARGAAGEVVEATDAANTLIKGPFCFIQTSEGKVVLVAHDPNEKPAVVNLKKAIASAFQANFKNTAREEEEDAQSRHISHYSFSTADGPNTLTMQRTVVPDDVIEATTESIRGKSVALRKSEEVSYKDGVLQTSSGVSTISIKRPVPVDEERGWSSAQLNVQSAEGYTDEDVCGRGSYTLKLQKCYPKNRYYSRRSTNTSALVTSRLAAVYEKGNTVKQLIMLESQHGPLPGYATALSEVVDYLQKLTTSRDENDMEMRTLLYSFIAADGSIKSQKMLVEAIESSKNQKERNTLTVILAFVRGVHPDILSDIEDLIKSSNTTTDPLILAYGSLASSLSSQLQLRVIRFLHSRVNQNDEEALIHLIHSMGNTESNLTERFLISTLAHSNPNVRLTAIYALRYCTVSLDVQHALLNILYSDLSSEKVVETILRALIAGTEFNLRTDPVVIGEQLFEALLTATKESIELREMLAHYVKMLGPRSPNDWKIMLFHSHSNQQKRGTTWNENNDLYNVVLDLATRNSDVRSYPLNRAYLWGKSHGIPQLKVDTAFGIFAGFGSNANPSSYKMFTKAVARGYAFGQTKTAFEALLQSENKPGSSTIQNKVYISIVGKVLVDKGNDIPNCKVWTLPMYSSPTYSLLQFTYQIFIYIGGTLMPSIAITATGGAAVSFMDIVRSGIDLSATLEYRVAVETTGSYRLLTGPLELCLNLLHGWPNNSISLYVYYQTSRIRWCRVGPFPFPCGFQWGDKRRVPALSKDWTLPSSALSRLWSSCDPSTLQCPKIPA